MLTLICVFNDRDVLEARLLSGLKTQSAPHEIISIDNRASLFDSAAAALNHGSRQAHGDWLLFAHQDIFLLTSDWIERVERLLDRRNPAGWVGVAGCDANGKVRGFMLDRAALLGEPFAELMEVQTLDECLLIHRNEGQGKTYFDEAVPGWHAYGVEACCAAIANGKTNYVMPAPVWHDSRSTNLRGLEEAHAYVWRKHGRNMKKIHTTCGVLPDLYGWNGGRVPEMVERAGYKLRLLAARAAGINGTASTWFDDELEAMTREESHVDCLHEAAPVAGIVAKAFVAQPARERVVRHRFEGLILQSAVADCVVVARDLTDAVLQAPGQVVELGKRHRRLLLCLDLDLALRRPLELRHLARQSKRSCLAYRWDQTPMALLTLK
jgi:hypothetical protein